MGEEIAALGLFSGLMAALYGWRQIRLRRLVRERVAVAADPVPATTRSRSRAPAIPFVRRNHWVPWLTGLATAFVCRFGIGLPWTFCLMFGLIVALLGGLLDVMRVTRLSALIERQLADAIDLMVGALRAGAGVTAAIESALVEIKPPLRAELQEILGRLRFGDEPRDVFQAFVQRVPLETFRLLAFALATHWEVGGSLAPTLATVGRTIRDRIEVSRRIRSLTTQSRVSILAVLGATYFIALIIWRNDPQRMSDFLSTQVGSYLVTGAVVLQAIGIVWSNRIGRIKY